MADAPADPHNELLRGASQVFTEEERQINAVFAMFGHAGQMAQHFEEALSRFVVFYNRLHKGAMPEQDFQQLELSIQKKTMGALLRNLRDITTLSDTNVEARFDAALSARNYLMHEFFVKREKLLDTENGRAELLLELNTIGSLLKSTAAIANAMRIAVLKIVNIDEQGNSQGQRAFWAN